MNRLSSSALFALVLLPCLLLTDTEASGEKSKPHGAPERILVKFKKESGIRLQESLRLSTESEFGLQELKRFNLIDVHLYRTLEDIDKTIASLKESPFVEYVEPDNLRYARDTFPNDPSFESQWSLYNTGQSGGAVDADIDAPEAWDLTTGSPQVVVAVIDSGIDYNHEDLRMNMWENPGEIAGNGLDDDENGYVDDVFGINAITGRGDPLDDDGHGTHVAGIIAAAGDNGIGVSGVCWTCKMMALKFLPINGSGTVSDEIECIQYAVDHGARIINGSFGDYSFSQAEKDAIDAAGQRGVLCVFAAGNEGRNNDVESHFPSSHESENIIAVGLSDRDDELVSWSDFGLSSVDVAAPGLQILSAGLNNGYRQDNGASVATPHVTGIAALLKAYEPDITWQEIKSRMIGGVDAQNSMDGLLLTGGRVNAYRSLLPGENRILILQSESGGTTNPSPGTYTYSKDTEIIIWALPDIVFEFDSWSGSVDQSLQSNNPLTLKMDTNRALVANFRNVMYAPLQFSGRREENRSLSQKEFINVLTWQSHPLNVGIVSYRLYEILGEDWRPLSAVVSTSFEYRHRGVKQGQTYSYALVAVNNDGREGPPAFLILR
jgi:subtilisin family serine protease